MHLGAPDGHETRIGTLIVGSKGAYCLAKDARRRARRISSLRLALSRLLLCALPVEFARTKKAPARGDAPGRRNAGLRAGGLGSPAWLDNAPTGSRFRLAGNA